MRTKSLVVIGGALIVCGLLFNEKFIATALSPDGVFESSALRIRVFALDAFLIVLGGGLIKNRRRLYRISEVFVAAVGIIIIISGIIFDEWFPARGFGLYGFSIQVGVAIVDLLAVLTGYFILQYRNKDIIKNVFMFGCSSFISLILLELILQQIAPPVIMWVGTAKTAKAALYGWALPANAQLRFTNPDIAEVSVVRTNSQGWKDVEHRIEKPPGVFRILFLGDSNTYGIVPLEYLYTRKLEELLKERGIDNIEVLSMGVGGWGTDQALEALVIEGIRYNPDLVIYQFCGNDVLDNLPPVHHDALQWNKPFQYSLREGKLLRTKRVVKKEERIDKLVRFLSRRAVVFHVSKLIATFTNTFWPEKPGKNQDDTLQKTYWWDQYPMDPTSQYFLYTMHEESPELHYAFELLEALIVRMKQIAEHAQAEFLVFSEESDEGKRFWNIEWDRMSTDGDSDYIVWDGETYLVDWKRPLKNLAAICSKHNIPLIAPVRTYERYRYDPHPNRVGNLRMAEDIKDFLLSHNLITQ